ncbi:polysaccharide deacetylase family protein [Pseudomonas sp. QL9]|uniref:polysaccharide deacetylase family protein n=1 Tax=Pseudomonas sp. QL9 TaxID=3242725 RepID=UPI00352B6710
MSEAAGPERVASYDRALWPEAIDTPERFDRASRQEILSFAKVMQSTPLGDASAISLFTGVKKPDIDSVHRWQEKTRQRLVSNYRAAGGVANSWDDLQAAALLPLEASANERWQRVAEGFHLTYLYEQVRLAALFPAITSEILPLDGLELTGAELPDRHFALSFDDGPSLPGQTDKTLEVLRAQEVGAFFFVLGEKLEQRLASSTAEQMRQLYASQCLGSHGYRHASHQKLGSWRDSLEQTGQLIRQIAPGRQSVEPWFRPPYGQRSLELVGYLNERGGRLVLWNIDSQDWNGKMQPEAIRNRLMTLMLLWRSGIVLFHDIHPRARQVLPELLGFVRAGGGEVEDCRDLIMRWAGERGSPLS